MTNHTQSHYKTTDEVKCKYHYIQHRNLNTTPKQRCSTKLVPVPPLLGPRPSNQARRGASFCRDRRGQTWRSQRLRRTHARQIFYAAAALCEALEPVRAGSTRAPNGTTPRLVRSPGYNTQRCPRGRCVVNNNNHRPRRRAGGCPRPEGQGERGGVELPAAR